jgi:hypothetical protein
MESAVLGGVKVEEKIVGVEAEINRILGQTAAAVPAVFVIAVAGFPHERGKVEQGFPNTPVGLARAVHVAVEAVTDLEVGQVQPQQGALIEQDRQRRVFPFG